MIPTINDEINVVNLLSTSSAEDVEEPPVTERSIGFLRRRRDMARKRLAKTLGLIDRTEDFLHMIWAVDKIGEGNQSGWPWFTQRPELWVEAASQPHIIHKWTLESLVNAFLLSRPLRRRGNRPGKALNTRHLASPFQLIQMTRDLEDAHDGLILHRGDVLAELPRIAQREFHWQRGKMNKPAFFKSAYLYTFPEADAYFQEKHGVSIHDFCFAGFALAVLSKTRAAIPIQQNVGEGIEIDAVTLAKCFAMFAQTEDTLRREAAAMAQVTSHAAYQSSVLRKWPCVRAKGEDIIFAPIPDLIVERFTNGLYYDLVDNRGELREKIGRRFEALCKLIFEAYLPDLTVSPEFKYGPAKHRIDSPDLFLVDKGETVVIVECKAKKAPISVKFGEGIDATTDPAFGELAKGVFQIWRFVSHVRRGQVGAPGGRFAAELSGVVVLMDSWLEMSSGLIDDIFVRARGMCVDSDPNIQSVDQIPVAFSNIDEVEDLLRSSTTAGALRTLQEAATPQRGGWLLGYIRDEVASDAAANKDYALNSHWDEVIKWWRIRG